MSSKPPFRLPGPRIFLQIAKEAARAWRRDGASSMGAALGFYALLSLAPMMLIGFSVAGRVFGERATERTLLDQLPKLIGDRAADEVQTLIVESRFDMHGGLATVVGVFTLLIGALNVFSELHNALLRIWHSADSLQTTVWWRYAREKMFSIGMVLGLGILVTLLISARTAFDAMGEELNAGSLLHYTVFSLGTTLSFASLVGLFALIFRYGPGQPSVAGSIWVGATVTAFLFTVGKVLLALYLQDGSFDSAYGAAGSFIGFLLWIYYSALIFLYGAEFTCTYARVHLHKEMP